MRILAILLIAAAWPAGAAERWIRATTPGIELYTTSGPKQAKDLLTRLEEVRGFFLKASPVRKVSEVPLRIIQFHGPEEYRRFTPNPISAAYFTGTPSRDYIVLGPAAEENFGIVVHEYVHLIVRHSGLHLPVWLNEGWADVYSTLRPRGKETAVGDLIPSRMESLASDKWLSFEELTTVTAKSPSYNESSRAGIFYAESWALAHMLYLAPEYQENFGKFVAELHAGKSADAACRWAWGRSGEQVFADLTEYFGRKKILGRIYDTRLEKAGEEPQESALGEFDRSAMLADLLALTGKTTEAQAEFERLDHEKPGNADVLWELGVLAVARHDEDAARAYYEKSFEAGEQDPVRCYQFALLEQKKGQPAKTLAALERALKSKPDYTEAAILLGVIQLDVRNFDGAIATLLGIDEVLPEDAATVYCTLADSYMQTGDLEAAHAHLATCRKWAKTDEQLKLVERVAALIEARSKPEAAVRKGERRRMALGTAVALDCNVARTQLRVQVNGKIAIFDLPAPAAVELTPAHGGQLRLKCGALPPVRLGVEFAPPLTAIGNSVGIVRRLEY